MLNIKHHRDYLIKKIKTQIINKTLIYYTALFIYQNKISLL